MSFTSHNEYSFFIITCSKFDQNWFNDLTVEAKKRIFKLNFGGLCLPYEAFFRKMT